jgi:hypothetical protein
MRKIKVRAHRRKGRSVNAHIRRLRNRLRYLSKKHKVPIPKLRFINMKRRTDRAYGFNTEQEPWVGDYDPRTKTIYMDKKKENYEPGTLEHEFKHYTQHLRKPGRFVKDDRRMRRLARKSFQEWNKRYLTNRYEAEARTAEKGVSR